MSKHRIGWSCDVQGGLRHRRNRPVAAAVDVGPATPKSASELLTAMRGKCRPLLVFFPDPVGERTEVPLLTQQRTLFAGHEADLKDRDVAVLFIPMTENRKAAAPGPWSGLRHQFQIDEHSFSVVLLGKDGGEKFRSQEPVTIEKLNALIDAMPMRQQEVRDGHHPE